MTTIRYPSLLIDLGHVGPNGLPMSADPVFLQELEICKKEGFDLTIHNSTVSLGFDQNQMVPYWIEKETAAIAWEGLRVHGFLRIESTNDEAVDMARKGAPSGTLVFAEEQTKGKGRAGRRWFSPPKAGVYASLIVKPTQAQRYWPLLTHVASIALVDTVQSLSELTLLEKPPDIEIKWPNDVLISGKKCAGILLESVDRENGKSAAVVGLGVNVRRGSYPELLESEAVCLDEVVGRIIPRRKILVQFLNHFQEYYLLFEEGRHDELLRRWKAFSSMCDGVPIWINEGSRRRPAVTCGLNEMGALQVRTADGGHETLLAGDIRIRRDAAGH